MIRYYCPCSEIASYAVTLPRVQPHVTANCADAVVGDITYIADFARC
jgi:hypothetical protein